MAYSGTLRNSQWSGEIAKLRHWILIVCYAVLAVALFFALNWIYQVVRKPGEIFGPVSGSLSKSPKTTWQSYGPLFERYSTDILSSEFLAALAQVEGSGNPVARTYWRWEWSWNPLKIYRPASSALGMFQITDGTFAEARKYCIHDHKVVGEGSWYDLGSCWFNGFYTRILPSHAIEMTAAYLHRSVVNILAAHRLTKAGLAQKQKLAAVIHLCGANRGDSFARKRFQFAKGDRCGTQSLGRYLAQIDSMKQRFVRLKNDLGLIEAELNA
jgi:hypothetical protein